MGAGPSVHRVRVARMPARFAPNGVTARLARTKRLLMGLVVMGIVLRLATFESWGIVYDGAEYAVMGKSFLEHGEFVRPHTDGTQYYRHYAPLYPIYLSFFYALFGFSVATTKLASLVISGLFLCSVYLTTRNLLGRTKAWFATAFVSVEPMFLITSSIGYSESLVGLLFVSTMWAVVRGIRNPRFVLLAGVLAGLGFLAKASIGYVFVFAGVAGVLWRVRFHGFRALVDRWYLGGIAAFVLLAGGWSLRNVARFGWPNWETSAVLSTVYAYGLAHPAELVQMMALKSLWFVAIFAFYAWSVGPELRRSVLLSRADEERAVLWMSIAVIFGMGWIVSSFFAIAEGRPVLWHDNVRYVVVAIPVLLWAALHETSFSYPLRLIYLTRRTVPVRLASVLALFVCVGIILTLFPAPYSHLTALHELDDRLVAGDVLAVDGFGPEAVIAYLERTDITVVGYASGFSGNYILSSRITEYAGFVKIVALSKEDFAGQVYACTLWVRG